MAGKRKLEIDEAAKRESVIFSSNLESSMYFDSDFASELLAFDWVDEIEDACPFLDTIIRNPKLALIKEENVVLIEKSKKVDVSSVKDLARHTERINRYDKRTENVEPSKILDIRSEETFNTYENRFLYTVVKLLDKFIYEKEKKLKNFELKDEKLLEYKGETRTSDEKVMIEVKVTSTSLPTDKIDNNIKDKLKDIKKRIKRIKEYIASWEISPMMKEIDNAHISLVEPPIKKTNVILKNHNFQRAVMLFEFLHNYDYEDNMNEEESLESKGGNILLGYLNQAFLTDYFVMNSVSKTKRDQKQNMVKYAIILLIEEVERTLALLKSAGLDLTEEELMRLITKELKNHSDRLVGADDVKKKFKSAMNEYLERTQDYL